MTSRVDVLLKSQAHQGWANGPVGIQDPVSSN